MLAKDLFNEKRVIAFYDKSTERSLTDAQLQSVVTVNANLVKIGYTMKPEDLLKIATRFNESAIVELNKKITSFVKDMNASPMYEGFPKEVMEMDEAIFRLHQICHYFSTYGLEILGHNVSKGWLPESNKIERIEDETLVDLKQVDVLYSKEDTLEFIFKNMYQKAERLTVPEVRILTETLEDMSAYKPDFSFKFKENQIFAFSEIFKLESREERESKIIALAQHPIDVLKMFNSLISDGKFRLKTTQKRMFVNVLESFSPNSLEENFTTRRKEFIKMLELISYNKFSKKPTHKQIVHDFRDKKLVGFLGKYEKMIASGETPELIINHLSQRPGVIVRKIFELSNRGIPLRHIEVTLTALADSLKTQTLVELLNYFTSDKAKAKFEEHKNPNQEKIVELVKEVLKANLSFKKTGLENKKVFIDSTSYNFDKSSIETNSKSAEGGYIRSGLAFNIPEEIKVLRFLTYWNDETRVDIDLHTTGFDKNGETYRVGWNADYQLAGMIHSGDITHSDAAEYIDIDMDLAKPTVDYVEAKIINFTKQKFAEIETIFTGIMAVSELNEQVRLYDKKNLVFYHELNDNVQSMNYAKIYIADRFIKLTGQSPWESKFSVTDYLKLLFDSQNVEIVDEIDEDTVVLSLEKIDTKNENLVLLDENFFMD